MSSDLRDGSVSSTAPRFQRGRPQAHTPSAHEQQLETRVRELQQQLASRLAELEAQRTALRGELEQARSALGARELEFDAERQEHKAAIARVHAELLKRDGRNSALEADVQRLEPIARERPALESRLADAERLAGEHARTVAQQHEELEQARNLQRAAEHNAALLQARVAGHDRDTASLRESVRSLNLRLSSVRKILQQAGTSLGEINDATDAEIVTAPPPATGTAKDGPPPLVTPAGSVKPGVSLADLEAQAQRELRQLGNKGGSLFKGRAKG